MINKTWQEKALEYFNQGLSSRKICKKLGWETTKKSTINTFLKPYREALLLSPLNKLTNEVVKNVKEKRELQVLYFDIENSPEEGYFWNRWKTNIAECQVKRYSHILTVAWAFNDGEVQTTKISVDDVANEDDLTAVVDLAQAINKADIIVGFNSKKFDIKVLKTRMIKHGLPPLKPVKHIDIYQTAKSQMRFPSNSMDNIAKYLGYSDLKIKTNFDLWKRCLDTGNFQVSNNALEEMRVYNKHDIVITRNLYKKFQGWTTGVNVGTIVNKIEPENHTLRCSKCGSDDIHAMEDFTYTQTSGFGLYRCGNEECRGVSRITSNGKNLVGVV